MEKRPQQIIVKTTRVKETQLDTARSSKPAVFDAAEQHPETKTKQVKPEAGLELLLVLSEINKKLDLLEKRVDIVDELLKNTTMLT